MSKLLGREPTLGLDLAHGVPTLAIGHGADIALERRGLIRTAVASRRTIVTRSPVMPAAGRKAALLALLLAVLGPVGPIIWDFDDGEAPNVDDPSSMSAGTVDELQPN